MRFIYCECDFRVIYIERRREDLWRKQWKQKTRLLKREKIRRKVSDSKLTYGKQKHQKIDFNRINFDYNLYINVATRWNYLE